MLQKVPFFMIKKKCRKKRISWFYQKSLIIVPRQFASNCLIRFKNKTYLWYVKKRFEKRGKKPNITFHISIRLSIFPLSAINASSQNKNQESKLLFIVLWYYDIINIALLCFILPKYSLEYPIKEFDEQNNVNIYMYWLWQIWKDIKNIMLNE